MYYIYSAVISIILFLILKNIMKKDENKRDYDIEDIASFIILYLITTVITYYIEINISSPEIKQSSIGGNINEKSKKINNYDPEVLNRINEDINVGFSMFDNE